MPMRPFADPRGGGIRNARSEARVWSAPIVQVDNATLTVLSLAKFVIRGVPGAGSLSPCTRHWPRAVMPFVGAAMGELDEALQLLANSTITDSADTEYDLGAEALLGDPCGENGEFHTCVYAGPMFRCPLQLAQGELIRRESFLWCDLP